MEPCSNCAQVGSVKSMLKSTLKINARTELLMGVTPQSSVPCPDGLSVAELNLDHLFARRDSRCDLLGVRVVDDTAIRVRILAVETEGNPAWLRSLGRFFEDRH